MKHKFKALLEVMACNWRNIALFGGGLVALVVLFQVSYPADRLAPFTGVDGLAVGGWNKADAVWQLDKNYSNKKVGIYFGPAKSTYLSPTLADIGISVKNADRVGAIDYPWYLRIIPTSILWAHFINEPRNEPVYDRDMAKLGGYINSELGATCDIKPQDASLKAIGKKLEVVPARPGGICDINIVTQQLSDLKPRLSTVAKIDIPINETAMYVSDDVARKLGDELQSKAGAGITVTVGGVSQLIPAMELFSWMDFGLADGKLNYSFNTGRAATYLNNMIAPKVAISAGTTTVTMVDFAETARVDGVDGRVLNIDATLVILKSFLDGQVDAPIIKTTPIAPAVEYKRSYSATDVGISAFMEQYAQSHPGIYGVAMMELSGKNRKALYNETRLFTTASTYKLFVAYSSLKRIEDGSWNWTDQIVDGRNLTTCLDDMIARSDNNCGSKLLLKIGHKNLTDEAHAIGCVDTTFMGNDGVKTTASDLMTLLAQLQTGRILKQQSSRDILIGAMKRNVYRQGIPTGIDGVIADKVGFMDNLLHDAAIVYSPTGTYVLVIVTEDSNWPTIADFAAQIESLRSQ